jgi:hypothetical protein
LSNLASSHGAISDADDEAEKHLENLGEEKNFQQNVWG